MRKRSRNTTGTVLTGAREARSLTRTRALDELPPVLYAVLIDGSVIKIGHSENMAARMNKYGSRAKLLGFMPGTAEDEAAIHAELRKHRHHGWEYYRPVPQVIEVVNSMRARCNLKPITR